MARTVTVRVRGSILDELRAQDWVPRPVRSRTQKLKEAREALKRELGRTPNDEELGDRLGLGPDEVRHVGRESMATNFISLSGPADCNGNGIDDAIAVVVVFGEDEGFGDPFHFIFVPVAFGEAFFEAAIFIGLDDGANLVGGQDAAVELSGEPFFFLVEHFEAFLFGEAVADFDGGAGFDFVALFGELGFDAVDVVAHIDLVDHGVFVGVFGDEVLPKKADGLFGGCGGEANEEGIEVFEHLAPEVVDGAVAFVDDDDIELFDGDVGVVADGSWLFADGAAFYFKP